MNASEGTRSGWYARRARSAWRDTFCRLRVLVASWLALMALAPNNPLQAGSRTPPPQRLDTVARSSVHLEGDLEYVNGNSGDLDRREQRTRFSVWLSGNLWLVRVTPVPAEDSTVLFRSIEVGTDGTNSYTLTVNNPNYDLKTALQPELRRLDRLIQQTEAGPSRTNLLVTKRHLQGVLNAQRRRPPSVNQALGYIQPGNYPSYRPSGCAALLWFAYCSATFLDQQRDRAAPRLWPPEDPEEAQATNLAAARLLREPEAPWLPTRAWFLHAGTRLTPLPSGMISAPLGPPFNDGYTNAVFEVQSFTNCQQRAYPASFTLTCYSPRGAGLQTGPRFRGEISSVTITPEPVNFIPRLPVTTLVEDKRLAMSGTGPSRQYIAPPGPWLTTTNQALLTGYQRQMLAAMRARAEKRRHAAALLMGVLMMSGLGLLCWNHLYRSRENLT